MLKKLLSKVCLLALFLSCGKNIESSGTDNDVTELPALKASRVLMEVSYAGEEVNSDINQYELLGSGWVRIPNAPFVKAGGPLTFKTNISFNVAAISTLNNPQEIVCEYLSFRQLTPTENPPEDGYNHSFKGCFTYISGVKETVNYTPGQEFPVDAGNLLILEVSSSDTVGSVQVQSDIEIDWH